MAGKDFFFYGIGKIRLANILIWAESSESLLHYPLLSDVYSTSLTICYYHFHITTGVFTMCSVQHSKCFQSEIYYIDKAFLSTVWQSIIFLHNWKDSPNHVSNKKWYSHQTNRNDFTMKGISNTHLKKIRGHNFVNYSTVRIQVKANAGVLPYCLPRLPPFWSSQRKGNYLLTEVHWP